MTDLVGLTCAMTDAIVQVKDEELEYLGFKKGFFNSRARVSYAEFLDMLKGRTIKTVQGGSPANVIYGAAMLGLDTALFGAVGNDECGLNYIKSLEQAGIEPLFHIADGPSGLCHILITPDGERTETAMLGVAGRFDFDFGLLEKARVFHTSGYELITDVDKVLELINYVKGIGAEFSFDLAEHSMVARRKDVFQELIKDIDILFATEEEAEELTGLSPLKALDELSTVCPTVILKKGDRGSIVKRGMEQYDIPICKVDVVNKCGAGDGYAAGFLYGYLTGLGLEECGLKGSYIASRVVASEESRFLG